MGTLSVEQGRDVNLVRRESSASYFRHSTANCSIAAPFKSDLLPISPYNITLKSNIKVMSWEKRKRALILEAPDCQSNSTYKYLKECKQDSEENINNWC